MLLYNQVLFLVVVFGLSLITKIRVLITKIRVNLLKVTHNVSIMIEIME